MSTRAPIPASRAPRLKTRDHTRATIRRFAKRAGGSHAQEVHVDRSVVHAAVGSRLGQDAKSVIATASKAMGADALSTIEYTSSGSDCVLGQAYSPDSAWPRFTVPNRLKLDVERVIPVHYPADGRHVMGG